MENQEVISKPPTLVSQENPESPEQEVEFARRAARILVQVIESKPRKVIINNETYLEFEDWMMLARFWGASVGIEWSHPILQGEKVIGYEARAIVHLKGEIISSAEAMCTRDERNWAKREEFMLRSMAQTRASAKALRNVFSWVVVMAGYRPTPAEEMVGTSLENPATGQKERKKGYPSNETDALKATIYRLLTSIFGMKPQTEEDVKNKVLHLTQLELTPENYAEIASRLSVVNQERNEKLGR